MRTTTQTEAQPDTTSVLVPGLLTVGRVQQVLDYDAETGLFRWRTTQRRIKAGAVAGWVNASGHVLIKIDRRSYFAHQLAWFVVNREWPPCRLDHEDNDHANNRIANLRLATHSQNMANRPRHKTNKSGFKGVCRVRSRRKWRAQIGVQGRRIYLGLFDRPEDAYAAYVAAATKYHGEFARLS